MLLIFNFLKSFFLKNKIFLLKLAIYGSIAVALLVGYNASINYVKKLQTNNKTLTEQNVKLNSENHALNVTIDNLKDLALLRDTQNQNTVKVITHQNTIREIINDIKETPQPINCPKPFDNVDMFNAAVELRAYQTNSGN